MLWYKSWVETRSRFLIGLALLICSAAATVFTYPKVLQLLTMMPAADTGGSWDGASARRRNCRANTAATCGRSGSVRT